MLIILTILNPSSCNVLTVSHCRFQFGDWRSGGNLSCLFDFQLDVLKHKEAYAWH